MAWDRVLIACRMSAALALALAALQLSALLSALRQETQTRERVVAALPALVDHQAAALRGDLRREAAATRDLAEREIRILTSAADARLAAIQVDATGQLAAVAGEASQLLARYRRVPDDIAWATETIWDCESNADCLENRYVSVSRAVEKSARAIEAGVPGIVRSAESASSAVAHTMPRLAEHSAGVAANLNRITKPRWYDRLLAGALGAGVIAIK